MAKRLIDASDEHIQDILKPVPYYPDEIWKFTAMTKRFPTVDAVEVVRCGQCKHWDVDPDTYGDGFGPEGICFGICDGAKKTKHDDFCFCGERRCEE